MDFVPHREFQRCVARYQADRHLRRFSCWDQWLCMVFAQLTHRESLRDLESCLHAVSSKLYQDSTKRVHLADSANCERPDKPYQVGQISLADCGEEEYPDTVAA